MSQDFKIVFDKNPDWEAGTDLEGSNKMCLDPIRIEGNTIESKAFPFMVYENKANEEHIVLNVENAHVQFNGNTINEKTRSNLHTLLLFENIHRWRSLFK